MPKSEKYSAKERAVLSAIILQKKSIVECRKSDAASLREKYKAWREIATTFNSIDFVTKRTCEQLRKWWSNEKHIQKKMNKTLSRENESGSKACDGSETTFEAVMLTDNMSSTEILSSLLNSSCSDTTRNSSDPIILADVNAADSVDIDNKLFGESVQIIDSSADILSRNNAGASHFQPAAPKSSSLGFVEQIASSNGNAKKDYILDNKTEKLKYELAKVELSILQRKLETVEVELQHKKEMHALQLKIQRETFREEERRREEAHQASEKRKQESHDFHEKRLQEIHQLSINQ